MLCGRQMTKVKLKARPMIIPCKKYNHILLLNHHNSIFCNSPKGNEKNHITLPDEKKSTESTRDHVLSDSLSVIVSTNIDLLPMFRNRFPGSVYVLEQLLCHTQIVKEITDCSTFPPPHPHGFTYMKVCSYGFNGCRRKGQTEVTLLFIPMVQR